jgi:hypothetical protein
MNIEEVLFWEYIKNYTWANDFSKPGNIRYICSNSDNSFVSPLLETVFTVNSAGVTVAIRVENLEEDSIYGDCLRLAQSKGSDALQTVEEKQFPWSTYSFEDMCQWIQDNGEWPFGNPYENNQ